VSDQPAGEASAPPTVPAYLDALAAGTPTPGGGSAAALVGAMGAALVSMVANYTVGRPRFAAVEGEVREALAGAEAARARLAALMAEDEQAYAAYTAATRLPRGTEEEQRERARAMQAALRRAAGPPLAMAGECRRVLDLASVVARAGNPLLASDAGVAALLAESGLRASAVNVRVNLGHLRDPAFVAETEAELSRLLEGTAERKEEILALATRRMGGDRSAAPPGGAGGGGRSGRAGDGGRGAG
jgi:methenyltetrahydrofolate cyclohydrolase